MRKHQFEACEWQNEPVVEIRKHLCDADEAERLIDRLVARLPFG
jgi:hypothetical protein